MLCDSREELDPVLVVFYHALDAAVFRGVGDSTGARRGSPLDVAHHGLVLLLCTSLLDEVVTAGDAILSRWLPAARGPRLDVSVVIHHVHCLE